MFYCSICLSSSFLWFYLLVYQVFMDWLLCKRDIWFGHLQKSPQYIKDRYPPMIEAKQWADSQELLPTMMSRSRSAPTLPAPCGAKPAGAYGDKPVASAQVVRLCFWFIYIAIVVITRHAEPTFATMNQSCYQYSSII